MFNNAKGAIIDATLVESAGRPDKYMDNPVEDRKEDECSTPDVSYGKDTNARWIKKGKKSHYGYKVFANVDDEHGFRANRKNVLVKYDCKSDIIMV